MLILLVVSFLALMLLGMPVAISMGLSSVFVMYMGHMPLVSAAQKACTGIDSFLFVAIPLFILTGELMNYSKITDRIFVFAKAVVGRIPGGLAHACVFANVIFAGMSGSAIADASGLGTVEIKAMKDNGFDEEFSASITAASSTIGPIIPPSIPMVIYGGMAEVSVGKLFMGGVGPGVLMAAFLSMFVIYYALKRHYPVRETMTWNAIITSFFKAIIPLLTPLIVLGGIVTGYFTATEASAIAAFYALIVGFFVYRQLGVRQTFKIFQGSAISTSNVMVIIGCASVFSFVLNQLGAGRMLTDFVSAGNYTPFQVVVVISVVVFIMGMFMESGAILILLVPIVLPVLRALNIDLIYFGVVLVLNLMIGMVTPPVGMVLFVVTKIANISFERMTRGILPFLIPLVAVLVLSICVPEVVTWLPNKLMP